MTQLSIYERVKRYGLVPVVSFQDAEQAAPVAAALAEARLGIIEITLRTKAGLESIRRVKNARPDMLVGAGTVISLESAAEAVEAGAEFIVLPGYQGDIVDWCSGNAIPIFPGCVTPSEIQTALRKGLRILKFFPANVYGGFKAMKALNGPFASSGLSFIPTGGVDNNNLDEYTRSSFIAAVGGTWLCPEKYINERNLDNITETAKTAIDILLGFGYAEIGGEQRNCSVETGGEESSADRTDAASIGGGAGGCIMIQTNDLSRAEFYLEAKGFRNCDGAGVTETKGGVAAKDLKSKGTLMTVGGITEGASETKNGADETAVYMADSEGCTIKLLQKAR
jgi:2-dehydro-3-deoxyphosphogluconate aldolase/(4S)-4-hydroxy-2-oxoglutarate aldolase